MMKLVTLLLKRPSDLQIKKTKVGLGGAIITVGVIAFFIQNLVLESMIFGLQASESVHMILPYIIIALGAPSIIFGFTDIHVLSRGYTRIAQAIFGIFLCMLPGFFVNTAYITVDILYPLIGIFFIFAGISGKFISTKGLKHGQKIKKIRV